MNSVRLSPFFSGLRMKLEIELGLVGRKMNLRWKGNDPLDAEAFKKGVKESASVISRISGESRRYKSGFSDGIHGAVRRRNMRTTSHYEYDRGYSAGESFAEAKEKELFDE